MKYYIQWEGTDKEIKMPIKAKYLYEALAIHKEMQTNDTLERGFRLIMINKNGIPLIIG